MTAGTMFDKLWDDHVILTREDGAALLWVDRHYVHEGSHHAFRKIAGRGLGMAQPALTVGVADHYVPTRGTTPATPEIAGMVETLEANAAQHGSGCSGWGMRGRGSSMSRGPNRG